MRSSSATPRIRGPPRGATRTRSPCAGTWRRRARRARARGLRSGAAGRGARARVARLTRSVPPPAGSPRCLGDFETHARQHFGHPSPRPRSVAKHSRRHYRRRTAPRRSVALALRPRTATAPPRPRCRARPGPGPRTSIVRLVFARPRGPTPSPRTAARAGGSRRRSRACRRAARPGAPGAPRPAPGRIPSRPSTAVGVERAQRDARLDDRDRQRVVEQVAGCGTRPSFMRSSATCSTGVGVLSGSSPMWR